ncbi:alpha-tocopherol transfer protein-like isoform X2 [Centruroides sculpturatus]|uniref:alpha-tocopherol transfer protein-like isoform X2 n=1 Tax=Centruroides sculpturatus TaxID=218467 RepID=UPI000C6CFA1C|nr:alpha-tocopherol transfer protein-like isoform X2 [Centruroides sculpturatus]
MDDIFLLSFLRARKFDRERALTLLKNYYLTRRKYPIVFKNLKPSAIEEILRQNMLSCVKTDNNMVITVASYGHWDATKVEILDVLRVVLLFLDFELNDHPIQVNGLYLLLDAKDISWRHIIQYTPRNIQLVIMSMVMHLYGSDMKELHKVIDPKYLPAEFNGELPTFDSSEYIKKLKDNEEFFVENEKYWTEENST